MPTDFIKRSVLLFISLCSPYSIDKFAKIWEPTFKHLISLCDRPASGVHIDEIWSIDAVNSGDSALLNQKSLGDVCESTLILSSS
jgi:hypothetical protein